MRIDKDRPHRKLHQIGPPRIRHSLLVKLYGDHAPSSKVSIQTASAKKNRQILLGGYGVRGGVAGPLRVILVVYSFTHSAAVHHIVQIKFERARLSTVPFVNRFRGFSRLVTIISGFASLTYSVRSAFALLMPSHSLSTASAVSP
jgi:hypothetical protein